MEFRNQIHGITYELCGNELIAYLLESHEIKKYWPEFNRSQRFTRYCWGIHQYYDQNGYLRLAVSQYTKGQQPVVSFKSFDETWDYLRNQVEKYALCKRLCNIQTVSGSCLDYPDGNCKGACMEVETPQAYNQRVLECIDNFSYLMNSYLLLGKGRSDQETSMVMVKNGRYRGFGFVDEMDGSYQVQDLIGRIKPFADNQDVQRIISTFLKAHPRTKQINFTPETLQGIHNI